MLFVYVIVYTYVINAQVTIINQLFLHGYWYYGQHI